MQYLIPRSSLHGFGALTTQQESSAGGAVVGAAAGAIIGGPVGAAVGAGIAAISGLIGGLISGCGATCQVATTWANEAEVQLQNNIAAYFAIPAPRPLSVQQAALQNFMTVWNFLVQNCNNPSLGQAGQNCISDRQQGACKWKQTSTPPWGAPVAGQCWNWWSGYHDPIANDPNVVPDAQLAVNTVANSIGGSTTTVAAQSALPSWLPLAAAAGLILMAVTN